MASGNAFKPQKEKELLMSENKNGFIVSAKFGIPKLFKFEVQFKKITHFRESSKANSPFHF